MMSPSERFGQSFLIVFFFTCFSYKTAYETSPTLIYAEYHCIVSDNEFFTKSWQIEISSAPKGGPLVISGRYSVWDNQEKAFAIATTSSRTIPWNRQTNTILLTAWLEPDVQYLIAGVIHHKGPLTEYDGELFFEGKVQTIVNGIVKVTKRIATTCWPTDL